MNFLEKFIDEYINSQTMPQVLFTWHGGENTYAPALLLQKGYGTAKETRPRTNDR